MNVKRWLLVGLALLVVLGVGGPFFYTHVVEGKAPKKLGLASDGTAPTTAGSATGATVVDGTWKVASGSQAGYRVKEVLFGQSHEAVGRTTDITGQLTITGTTVEAGPFVVDMTTVSSDKDKRDRQFQGRVMNTATYPTATFKLSKPIQLPSVPAENATTTVDVPGQLTMHGTTRAVAVHVSARRRGGTIQVSGSVPVTFADWNIPNPSFAGVVTTEDHGVMEFLLNFAHT
jgi:polyisoprenoid-binding protein YceI